MTFSTRRLSFRSRRPKPSETVAEKYTPWLVHLFHGRLEQIFQSQGNFR